MFSVTLVIAQGFMRGCLGITAGLMTGLGFGVGGLGVTILGVTADAWGIVTTMQLIAFLPLLPWILVWFLPQDAIQTVESAPTFQPATTKST